MDLDVIKNTALFNDMSVSDTERCLKALEAKEKNFSSGEIILCSGNPAERMGLVLEGSVTVESTDIEGMRTILSKITKGHLFAETYSFLKGEPMLVDAVAASDCRILFLRTRNITGKENAEPWARRFILNLLAISARKNLNLSERSFYTAPKNIRGRVMAYLTAVSMRAGSDTFDIPYDRQQLADYLNVERSALSKELGKMKRDGLIDVKKNHFRLLKRSDRYER